jgi:hypothetical protein
VPPQPVIVTICAVIAIGYSIVKLMGLRERFRNLYLGLDGEKAVGQYLERLRAEGCRVFHDIVGKGFNIDHVVISPHGVFVIETKTYRKPKRGPAIVEFDGERILINGFEPERNAITQVRALGGWLQELLEESTGRRFPVRGVVVLPGWFVEVQAKTKTDVWVLNPKALPSFIEHEPVVVEADDIALISSRINLYLQDAIP